MTSSAVASQDLQTYLDELWLFLDRFDHSLQQKKLDDLRRACSRLVEGLPSLPSDDQLKQRYHAMREGLDRLLVALEEASAERWAQSQQYLKRRHLELSRSYEHWLSAWRAQRTSAASLRPLNHARTAFHVSMALAAAGCYQFLLSQTGAVIVLATLLTVFGSLEITRRMWPKWNDVLLDSPLFKRISRPHEYHRVNSATYYLIALLVVTPFFSRPEVISGILILGFADPAAAWIGKRYGKRKLLGKKTVVGTSAFMITGFVVAAAFLLVFYPALPLGARLLGALAASVFAGVVELVATRIDDNLAIPLAAVTAAALFF